MAWKISAGVIGGVKSVGGNKWIAAAPDMMISSTRAHREGGWTIGPATAGASPVSQKQVWRNVLSTLVENI